MWTLQNAELKHILSLPHNEFPIPSNGALPGSWTPAFFWVKGNLILSESFQVHSNLKRGILSGDE